MSETKKYVALVGMNFTPTGKKEEVRVEPGENVTGLPVNVLRELLAQGSIEEVK